MRSTLPVGGGRAPQALGKTMNCAHLRLSVVALGAAAVGFVLFALGSMLAWRFFPYPVGADDSQRQIIWSWHILGEKGAQFIVLALLGFIAARLHHPTWRAAVCTAVLAGLLFQTIAMSVYTMRFGFVAYRSNHAFWDTLLTTASFSGLFGFLAVYRQYRRAKKPNNAPQPTPFRRG